MNDKFSLSRSMAIALKETMHIRRDPFILAMAAGLPVILVIFFGFAINFDFKNINLAVFDMDHSKQSRELARLFGSSEYFNVKTQNFETNPIREVESERSSVAVVINPEFSKNISLQIGAKVQVLVDGTDNMKSGVIIGYIAGLRQIVNRFFSSVPQKNPLEISTRFLYNPELDTQWFVVPGLIVVVTGLLSIFMTALTVAREWENGSMELILSTPVKPVEVIAGKILPYLGLGLIAIVFVYTVARVVFGVPFLGSYTLLSVACVLFITTLLAQGILISVATRQQQKAMQIAMVAGLLPALLLSGFVFPIESMPVFFRYFTMILPARWFMDIIRGIFLKGAGIRELYVPFAALFLMNVFFVFAAVKRFKKDIE
ncbi:MAG: ABC transporter permease [Elusimicrobia bacterium]|nr:ABC transporter permease [Candidatus Liberimonas magnetica]